MAGAWWEIEVDEEPITDPLIRQAFAEVRALVSPTFRSRGRILTHDQLYIRPGGGEQLPNPG